MRSSTSHRRRSSSPLGTELAELRRQSLGRAWAALRVRGSVMLLEDASQSCRGLPRGVRPVRRDQGVARCGPRAAARGRRRLAGRAPRPGRAARAGGRPDPPLRPGAGEDRGGAAHVASRPRAGSRGGGQALGPVGGGDRRDAGHDVAVERPDGARPRPCGSGSRSGAELLLREALDVLAETDYRNGEPEALAALAGVPARTGTRGGGGRARGAARRALRPERAARII